MTKEHDDLEAVRTLVETLKPFDAAEQERVMRWAREKLGLPTSSPAANGQNDKTGNQKTDGDQKPGGPAPGGKTDIKSFVSQKNPASDNNFAATVAYYYRFEAPENLKKDSITAEDLQEACRQAGRERLKRPAQTLINTQKAGLIDKAGERGAYIINTVGENLVAVTLPNNTAPATPRRARKPAKTTKANKKTTKKEKPNPKKAKK